MKENGRSALPYSYLFITLTWTWSFWFGAVWLGQSWLEYPAVLLTGMGFLGPILVAIIMIKLGFWDTTLKDYLQNCFDLRLLSIRWYFYIFGLILILAGLPLLIGTVVFNQSISQLARFSAPTPFIIIGIIAGAIEEPGWRGYAQKALQNNMSVLGSSIIVGVFWALWHLPLFLLEGTYQSTIGFGTSGFWFFNLSILFGSVVYAWLYNVTGQLVIGVVLYHGFGNAMNEILSFANSNFKIQLIEFSVEAIMAVVICIVAWRLMTGKMISVKKE